MQTFHHYYLSSHLSRTSGHDTYLAYPLETPEQRVVLKIFDAQCIAPHTSLSDFRQLETRLQALKHPHIVTVLELGIEQDKPYLVSDYQPGGSLRQYVHQRASARLSLEEAVGVVIQVGRAVAFAHTQGRVHQDIRPENILLNAQGKALLADFPLSSILVEREPLSRSDRRVRNYQAPEQMLETAEAASDQYALGCLLYELMTGLLPDPAVLRQQASLTELVAPTMVPLLPRQVEAVLLRALTIKPQERYPDVTAFLAALKSAVQPEPPAFPFARLTGGYQPTASDDPLEEEFPLLLSTAPFISPTSRLQEKEEAPTLPTTTSLEAFLTTPEWDGSSLLDRLTATNGQEDTLLLSNISETGASFKEPPPTSQGQDETMNETAARAEMALASLTNEDVPIQSSPHKHVIVSQEELLMVEEDPVFLSTLAEAEEDIEGELVFPPMLDEAEEDTEGELVFPSMLVETDEEPVAFVPPLSDRVKKVTDTVLVQQPAVDRISSVKDTQPDTGLLQSGMMVSPPEKTRGVFTHPPLPGWKPSIVWLGVALLLTTVASLLLYSFNAEVITQMMHTPVTAVATTIPTTGVTPDVRPTAKPLPTPRPTSRPTSGSKPRPTSVPNYPMPTPTPVPTRPPDFYTQATSGTPIYSSTMAQPDRADWGLDNSNGLSCSYAKGGYQISDNETSTYLPCAESTIALGDFTFQVEMVITGTGGDGAGVVFRNTPASEFRFRLSLNGTYDLGGPGLQFFSGTSTAIHSVPGQVNLVTIIAHGPNIYIYINKQRIVYITDTGGTSPGIFKLFAIDAGSPTTVLFRTVKIW